ncbi:hypothetical protein NIES1031_11915 [Chroogloeocystis siderophila 5.2 s.c.1]|jgi:hypothetical protein|uniref:Transposase IS4-like domain-containing protein n=1 Tax=Chroogloeocystis siderophila 5.2 s.c.1 TaxID=247279 RepID=A0A1U7HS89_9CHRO|nr:hypothetical protein NIES1031_11915 [Chroogloeocystis siderophila 5.2 s.c.1]
MLAREGFLRCSPWSASQLEMSQRLLTFSAELFEKVFKNLALHLKAAWYYRNSRTIPESIQFARSKFEKIWIAECSVLGAVFCKLDSFEEVAQAQLAGKRGTVIDLVTQLPVEIWCHENSNLLLDRGFYHFSFWLQSERIWLTLSTFHCAPEIKKLFKSRN